MQLALMSLVAKVPFILIVVLVIFGWIIWAVIGMALFTYVANSAWLLRWRLPKMAARLEMSYDPEARGLERLGCKGLPVLQAAKEARNLLHGMRDGTERFAVEVKRPKITDPAYFLVIGYRLRGRALPPFSVELTFSVELERLVDDARVTEEAAEPLGENPYRDPLPYHPVEVTGNRAFGKYFTVLTLGGENQAAVQAALTREVQDVFMLQRFKQGQTGTSHLEVQGAGEWVVVILPHQMPPRLAALTSRMDYERPVYEAFAGRKG